MTFKKHLLTAGILLAATGSALAYEAGDRIVRVGLGNVEPQENSSELTLNKVPLSVAVSLPATEVGVSTDTQPSITLEYMVSDKIGIEVLAATPFHHDINGINLEALGINDVASTKHLPPTISAHYYFADASSRVQPYVGIGINYTDFFDTELDPAVVGALLASDISLSSSTGATYQLGADFQVGNNDWFVSAAVWKMDIDTDAEITTGLGILETEVEVDPVVTMIGIGRKF